MLLFTIASCYLLKVTNIMKFYMYISNLNASLLNLDRACILASDSKKDNIYKILQSIP